MHPKYWKSGRKPVYCAPTDGDVSGGGGLDVHSAGDKLAAILGDDDGAEPADAPVDQAAVDVADGADEPQDGDQGAEGEPDQQAAPETITVEVDGQQVELTREQIAEAYKTGLKQQDLTRETAQVAEQRAAADAEKAQARAERTKYAQQLQQILAANQYQDQQDAHWTPETIEADPVGYQLATYAASKRAEQNQLAQAELQKIEQQQAQEQEQENRDYFARQKAALVKANPEWADDTKFKAGLEALEPFMIERGFTRGEGRHVFDARFIGLLQDAKKYHDIVSRAKDTAKAVAKVPPKVAPPGRQPVAPTDGRTVAMKQLKATGSVNDAASALSRLL